MSLARFHDSLRSPHRIRRHLVPILTLALALIPAGCNKETIEPPSVENFARAWHITSCEYRHQTDGARQVDLIDDGWTVDFYVNDNGAFFYVWTPPGGEQQSFSGTWTTQGEIVSLTRDGADFSWEFKAKVGEETMTMTGAHAEYDFDNDGTPEPAIWNLSGEN